MSHYNAMKNRMMRSHCAPERLVADPYLHCARRMNTPTHTHTVDGVYHLCQVVLKPYKSLPQYFPVITDWLDACKCSENGVVNYVTYILGKPVSF